MFFLFGIRPFVSFGGQRTDLLLVALPLQRVLKDLVKLVRNRDADFLARLELLDLDDPAVHVDLLPAQHDTVLETLAGEHADIKDDLDLVLVQDMVFRIVQNTPDLLFLFSGEGFASDIILLFLPNFAAEGRGFKRIRIVVVFLQHLEDFPQPLEFPIVGGDGYPGFFQLHRIVLGQMPG